MTAILLATTTSFAQFSQVWSSQFQHTQTMSFSNESRKVVQDAAGNIFVLADVTSDIDPLGVQGASTYHYVSLLKYSTTGSLLDVLNIDVADHQTSGFDNIGAFGMLPDASGNIYIGYATWNSTTGFDIALAMYDNNLNNVWTNSYPLAGTETGLEMKLDPSGNIYALIKSEDVLTSYTVIKSVPSNSVAVPVFSFPGSVIGLNSLALDNGSMAYVGGYIIKAGFKNAYLCAIDLASGFPVWNSIYTPRGITGDDIINDVAVGADGNIYSVGISDQGPAGNRILVLKNAAGSSRFDFVVLLRGSTANSEGRFVNASENGWVYIGAQSVGDNYAYVFRIPDNGIFTYPGRVAFTPVPNAAYNTINGITMKSMEVTTSKNVYITGGLSATGPSGDFTSCYLYKASVVFGNALIDAGGATVEGDFTKNYDGVDISLDYSKTDIYWLRNYWNDTHDVEQVDINDMNVPSPLRFKSNEDEIVIQVSNPSQENLIIRSSSDLIKMELFDLAGKIVFAGELSGRQSTLDIANLARGLYLCQVTTESGKSIKKVIIE